MKSLNNVIWIWFEGMTKKPQAEKVFEKIS